MIKELNEKNFKEETANGVCFVDFWAAWCGPCRMMSPVVEALAEKRADVKFFKVNVDEAEELALSFGIASIPFFMVLRDGEVSATAVGYMSESALVSQLGL